MNQRLILKQFKLEILLKYMMLLYTEGDVKGRYTRK